MAGRDKERQVRGRKGPASQSRGERQRKPARKGGANSARGGPSGDGLH